MTHPLRLEALALGAIALCALAACDRPRDPRPNIVLLVIDTLRQDHVGCYGAPRDTTPAIDALAREGVRFAQAYSTAPWTSPSVASILSGQLPTGHGLTAPLTGLAQDVETLAEMLRAEGYETAGVISNPHLKKHYFFDQGFEHWHQREAQGHKNITTPGVTTQAIELVEGFSKSDRPFFLFVLYFDPHYDYKRHPQYGFASDPGRITGKENIHELVKLSETMTETEIGYVRDTYDEEIRFTSDGIGRLLRSLRQTGVYDNTAIAITADHGEEFLERGWIGHCRTLYQELVHVPLVLRAPKSPGPRVVTTPVSLTSLVPTLRQIAGLAPNTERASAPSLEPLLAGQAPESWPPVFCEVDFTPVGKGESEPLKEAHKRALVQGRWKVIQDDRTKKVELYDLAADPLEKSDLAAAQPEIARELLALLERVHAAAQEGASAGPEIEVGDEEIETLRALGYAGDGDAHAGTETPETPRNPK
jgi:arylsulfatase A-like enzyme